MKLEVSMIEDVDLSTKAGPMDRKSEEHLVKLMNQSTFTPQDRM